MPGWPADDPVARPSRFEIGGENKGYPVLKSTVPPPTHTTLPAFFSYFCSQKDVHGRTGVERPRLEHRVSSCPPGDKMERAEGHAVPRGWSYVFVLHSAACRARHRGCEEAIPTQQRGESVACSGACGGGCSTARRSVCRRPSTPRDRFSQQYGPFLSADGALSISSLFVQVEVAPSRGVCPLGFFAQVRGARPVRQLHA